MSVPLPGVRREAPIGSRTASLHVALCVALLGVPWVPMAALAKQPPPRRPRTLDARRVEATVSRGSERVGVESGVPRALYGLHHPVAGETPEAMARQFLMAFRQRLRLVDPDLGDLVHRGTRRGRGGTTVRFEQRFQGIPVLEPTTTYSTDSGALVAAVSRKHCRHMWNP